MFADSSASYHRIRFASALYWRRYFTWGYFFYLIWHKLFKFATLTRQMSYHAHQALRTQCTFFPRPFYSAHQHPLLPPSPRGAFGYRPTFFAPWHCCLSLSIGSLRSLRSFPPTPTKTFARPAEFHTPLKAINKALLIEEVCPSVGSGFLALS